MSTEEPVCLCICMYVCRCIWAQSVNKAATLFLLVERYLCPRTHPSWLLITVHFRYSLAPCSLIVIRMAIIRAAAPLVPTIVWHADTKVHLSLHTLVSRTGKQVPTYQQVLVVGLAAWLSWLNITCTGLSFPGSMMINVITGKQTQHLFVSGSTISSRVFWIIT